MHLCKINNRIKEYVWPFLRRLVSIFKTGYNNESLIQILLLLKYRMHVLTQDDLLNICGNSD